MPLNPDVISTSVPEYGVDKIYYTKASSASVTGSNPNVDPPTEFVIGHEKGEIFDAEMIISEDGVNWYPAEFPPFAYNAFYMQYLPKFNGGLYVTSTEVHIFLQSTQTNRTIFYSILGYR